MISQKFIVHCIIYIAIVFIGLIVYESEIGHISFIRALRETSWFALPISILVGLIGMLVHKMLFPLWY